MPSSAKKPTKSQTRIRTLVNEAYSEIRGRSPISIKPPERIEDISIRLIFPDRETSESTALKAAS